VVVIVEKDFEINQHVLVPKHTKINEKEKEALLEKYQITLKDLPKISMKDPAVAHMELTQEDVIKIERPSATTKTTVFYRRVGK
jgi:DNA-directed RNA polymerase subunit H